MIMGRREQLLWLSLYDNTGARIGIPNSRGVMNYILTTYGRCDSNYYHMMLFPADYTGEIYRNSNNTCSVKNAAKNIIAI
jgi:hypothetical protein